MFKWIKKIFGKRQVPKPLDLLPTPAEMDDAVVTAIFDEDGKGVCVTSTNHELSNVRLCLINCDGETDICEKFDDLSGFEDCFDIPEDMEDEWFIKGVWIKAGNNQSGDCPGCGEFVPNPDILDLLMEECTDFPTSFIFPTDFDQQCPDDMTTDFPFTTEEPFMTTELPPSETTEPPLMTTQIIEESEFFDVLNCDRLKITVEDDQGILEVGQIYAGIVSGNCWEILGIGSAPADLSLEAFLSLAELDQDCECDPTCPPCPLCPTEEQPCPPTCPPTCSPCPTDPPCPTEPPICSTEPPGCPTDHPCEDCDEDECGEYEKGSTIITVKKDDNEYIIIDIEEKDI